MGYDDRKRRGGGCRAVFFLILFAGTAAGLYFWLISGRVPKRVILEADFEQGLIECLPDDYVGRALLSKKLNVREVVEALQAATKDERVKGLVARVGEGGMKLAQAQEVRDAIIAFRRSGKPALAFAETFGEAGPGNSSYYLATAFDAIYMQPSGDVGLTGLIYERSFFRGTLDKLGIVPRLEGRKEYKSYRYVLTERKYLPPHREAVTRVMESQFAQLVKGIADARKMSEERVRNLIDDAPFLGNEAVDAKLVDGLAYRDEVLDIIREKAGKNAELFALAQYRKRAKGPYEKGMVIALIYGVGGIERGKSGYNPATGESILGSDTVSAAIRRAAEDRDVKAILFRIDSPGGSYTASDTIRREIVNARKAGKPVIVSMAGTAGSGGYFIALAADKIVAQPATITGSIGVFGGKMITAGFWKKLGVTWDEVHTGRNADVWTQAKDLTPGQRTRLNAWLDRIYEDFTSKVAQSRSLSPDAVERAAKGRIWSGEDALRLGLVDELGGFPAALRLARQAGKVADNAPVRLKVYPEKKGLLGPLSELNLIWGEEDGVVALGRTLEEAQPFMKALAALGSDPRRDALRMPDFE